MKIDSVKVNTPARQIRLDLGLTTAEFRARISAHLRPISERAAKELDSSFTFHPGWATPAALLAAASQPVPAGYIQPERTQMKKGDGFKKVKAEGTVKRACLCCSGVFLSTGFGNRICSCCKGLRVYS